MTDSMEVAPVTTHGETTGFTEDATVKVNAERELLFPPVSANVFDSQTISMFLAKPRRVFSSSWTSASASNAILHSFSILDTLVSNTYWADKFAGYRYMRGTAVVRLELNAQPFHAGRLLMHFLPQYNARITTNTTYTQHNTCLCSKTQQNSVELDCRDSAAIMKLPFISPFSHADVRLATPSTDWGTVFLSVLSPLATGTGQDTAEYSIFLHFEDVELMAPVPQSGQQRKKKMVVAERENLAYTGKISGGLEKLSNRVDWMKTFVPSSVVETGKSILTGVAGVLDVFGWSKPIYEKVQEVFMNIPLRMITNYNGSNPSDVLALDAINSIDPIEHAGGLEHDEMHFSYLKAIPAYYNKFNWNTSTASGTVLTSQDCSPFSFKQEVLQTISDVSCSIGYAPPFSFLSRYFEYYRGSINLTLKFVKTQFHTGKLLIAYVPNGGIPSMDATQNALREIIDLKDSNEITLNLPYLQNTSYTRTDYGSTPSALDEGYQIVVYVLNPLVATDNVASTIEVLMYASAGEDFELLKPVAGNEFKVVAQMNVVQPVLVKKRIGGYSETPLSNIPAKTCAGEVFTSIKQLIGASRPIAFNVNRYSNTPSSGLNSISFWPWCFGVPTGVTPPSTGGNFVSIPAVASDYLSEFATGFAYYRGGLRYTINSTATANVQIHASIAPRDLGTSIDQNLATVPGTTFNYYIRSVTATRPNRLPNSFRNCAFRTSGLGPNLDVTVPYYGNTPFRFTHLNTGGDRNIPLTADTSAETLIVTTTGQLTDEGILRAASDDFQFSYFIGFIGFFITG
ncbi:hypothetical protein 2 [Changjiang picorna-like virus 13]|uniref:hypothetical protein 2 n=1 Tax=Changjiang picorna-like virus 13 TaxID=1922786 RepID=UPI00090B2D65|nr:hypothetical protein 2 [Changjiang picorna-like virus 13]APG79030.1 hypothetical protein 2 [Changjiang picorna-like virus 13]